jgi:hypothetical protein
MEAESSPRFSLRAGLLFQLLEELAAKPLPKGSKAEVCWYGWIDFPTDEEAHNDDLQRASTALADCFLALVEAGARPTWGEPDFRLSHEDEEFPAWTEDLLLPSFGRLVGWRRGRTMVAYALREQEDREIPINILLGVVRWRAGVVPNGA